MAAELVGGALLSGFLNVLFDRIATQEFTDFFRGNKVVAKLLDELKIRLLSANKLLNDAEEKQLRDQHVKKWFEELKDVIYEADHVTDKIDTESLRRELEEGEYVSKASKCLNCIQMFFRTHTFDKNVRGEIEEVLSRLKLLLDQKDVLGLREGIQTRPSQRLVAPLVEESGVYGREADKENIIKLLLSDNINGEKITLIPIVGMGGLGKTTLAQLVYNDRRVQDYFALKVWVTVSEEFDVFKLTRIIYKKITSKECEIEDLYELQSALKEELMGKIFLFVLDDVWNENYQLWDAVKSPFESGAHGSKIIVTTRSEVVASKMANVATYNLSTVHEDACWQLFSNHVFTNVNSGVSSNLEKIGIEIVKKCKGLPLAVKSMAGLLRSVSNPEEWRRILESDVWELQFQENQKNEILPALWLSYRFLPPQLKRCFTYCSIFPKDYEFREDEQKVIIWLWMAEGLVQEEKGKRMEDVGEEYWNALIARSFFQRSTKNGELVLLMHDLVHDLAFHMSGEYSFVSDGCNYLDNVRNKTRHLSYEKGIKEKTLPEGLSKVKHLRTLLALPLRYWYFQSILTEEALLEILLGDGGRLRVLSLCATNITKLPNSIGDLKHLRYLDLSLTEVEELPNSVCKLYNLQTMLLENCYKLTQLPTKMCCLVNLRHLIIKGTPLKEMPPQMCKLRNLQTLSYFVLGENGGSRIKELGELQSLHGSLCISGLENVADIADVLQADLKSKECLTELTLKWRDDYEADDDYKAADSTKEREVLAALKPHKKLKKLEIVGYGGGTFPNWVADESFGDMVEVVMFNCENVCLLPPLGQLPLLRKLRIGSMDGLESIGDELCGTSLTQPFPSLEILQITNTPSLEKWSFTRAEQEGEIFPLLKKIRLWSCGKLNVGLPASCFPSLEKIAILHCYEMVSVLPTSQVEIDSAYPSLESMKLRACPRVESFSGMGLPSNLKELEIGSCPMLTADRMNWDLQRLSSIQSLDIDEFEGEVDSFPEEGLLPSTFTYLRIRGFRNLKALNGKSFQHLTSLQELRISECDELRCLPEEGLPLSLTHLEICNCPLLNERCQRGTGEDWHKIQHIPNIQIYFKKML